MRNHPDEGDYRSPVVAGWCWIAMVLIALICSCAAQGAEPHQAVCRISNQVQGANNLGSGTLIDKTDDGREGVVLTCAHLFSEGTGQVLVEFADGKRHLARVLHVDKRADLAALLIGNPAGEPATVGLEMGEQSRLHACGYGARGIYRCAVGARIGQAVSPGQVSLLINDPVRSGDSGGGVFDQQGKLVAVIWGEAQGVTYASCGQPLRNFLKKVLGRRMSVVYRCPGGVCPTRPPATQKPVQITPWPESSGRSSPSNWRPATGRNEQSIVVDPRWSDFQRQIDQLRDKKQDRGDYLTRGELPDLSSYASVVDVQRIENDSTTRHESILGKLATLSGSRVGKAAGTAAVGLLGLSGPAGWGVLAVASLGGWFVGRQMKRRFSGAGGRRRRRFQE